MIKKTKSKNQNNIRKYVIPIKNKQLHFQLLYTSCNKLFLMTLFSWGFDDVIFWPSRSLRTWFILIVMFCILSCRNNSIISITSCRSLQNRLLMFIHQSKKVGTQISPDNTFNYNHHASVSSTSLKKTNISTSANHNLSFLHFIKSRITYYFTDFQIKSQYFVKRTIGYWMFQV